MSQLRQIEMWNRKIHIYIGLFLLWFIWLFGLSGMLLNHPQWLMQEGWRSREVSVSTHTIQGTPAHDLETVRNLMGQLDVTGEVARITMDPKKNRLDFRVARPGMFWNVSVDWSAMTAEVKTTRAGDWMALHNLHTFNGVQRGRETRDWMPTRLWVLSMDGVCVGLLLLVLSSLYMWVQVERMRWVGLGALGAGLLSCGFFVFGLG